MGSAWDHGSPLRVRYLSAAGASGKETAGTGTLPSHSCSRQFCSGPKLACFTQPNKGLAGGEPTLIGKGSSVMYVVNLICPVELWSFYPEKLSVCSSQLHLEHLSRRIPGYVFLHLVTVQVYFSAPFTCVVCPEHWSGWHTIVLGLVPSSLSRVPVAMCVFVSVHLSSLPQGLPAQHGSYRQMDHNTDPEWMNVLACIQHSAFSY